VTSGGVAPGWYPDYERPPGHQRYWDGERWTERRAVAPEAERPAAVAGGPGWRVWAVAAAVLALLVVCVGVGLGWGSSEEEAQPPPAAAPTAAEPTTVQVSAAVDGQTLRLRDGTEVRLAGITDRCGALGLAQLVVGREVTLVPAGIDTDDDGRLVRYVERGRLDVGKRLLQRGWATASPEDNPRRAVYRRVDERSPEACGA
jgi:endonuclease YncB( thermonuclease family)